MQVKQFRYSLDNLGYVIHGDKTAVAVDGGAVNDIVSYLETSGLELQYVVNTHSHPDHTMGTDTLMQKTGAEYLDGAFLVKKQSFEIDGESIKVFPTPGHTDDSISFYFDNVLIAGDTLFNGKVGKCFTGDLKSFYNSIKQILELPGGTVLYAGHDYVEEYMAFAKQLEPDNVSVDRFLEEYSPDHVFSTLNDELKIDPFLRFNDVKMIAILEKKGLPLETEYQRWESLMSLH